MQAAVFLAFGQKLAERFGLLFSLAEFLVFFITEFLLEFERHLLFCLEAFDLAPDIDEAVFSGIEGVAFVADFDRYEFFGGTGGELVAAGARDGGVGKVDGMNLGFHGRKNNF